MIKTSTAFDNLKAQERQEFLFKMEEAYDPYFDIDDYFTAEGQKDLFELCAKDALEGMMKKVSIYFQFVFHRVQTIGIFY